jgi:hypothetical protein
LNAIAQYDLPIEPEPTSEAGRKAALLNSPGCAPSSSCSAAAHIVDLQALAKRRSSAVNCGAAG